MRCPAHGTRRRIKRDAGKKYNNFIRIEPF